MVSFAVTNFREIACQCKQVPLVQTIPNLSINGLSVHSLHSNKHNFLKTHCFCKAKHSWPIILNYLSKCAKSSELTTVWNLGSVFKWAVQELSFISLLKSLASHTKRRMEKQSLLKCRRTNTRSSLHRFLFFLYQCCRNNNSVQHHLNSKKSKP